MLELLAQLGIEVQRAGQDTIVVSRNRTLNVTNIDSHSAMITDRAGAQGPEVFAKHKALYERMVTEHVVDTLRTYAVDCVLDVGANKGQYARQLRRAGYKGRIISFEPVPEVFEHLKRATAKDPKWSAQHCALGTADGTMPMHVVPGKMSSFLPISDYGERRYKQFQKQSVVDVPMHRLDELLSDIFPSQTKPPRIYLKLDTQGYDLEVFAGLGEWANNVVAMQSEVALVKIYEGMPRLPEAIETYENAGFDITGMFPVSREGTTRRVLEYDCVLAKATTLNIDR